jgi:NAD(P)-dependent dehydrogenase (short-subunit alcohol dehydrogenase family)
MHHDFTGDIAFVSGAGRGFGRAVSERLAAAGARLVVSDLTDAMLADTVDTIRGSGGVVEGVSGDISREAVSQKIAAVIAERHGHLTIAVNNAGIAQPQVRLHETDSALAEKVVAVDLMGVFYAMKHQIPLLLKGVELTGGQGRILNVASAAGQMGSPKLAIYSAAKHGVIGLTRSAAVEYGRKGLRINAICPSFARTDMVMKPLESSPEGEAAAIARMVAVNPMQRLGEVEEVVQAMIWAISRENSYFNGQSLGIDGGLSA